MMLRRSVIWVGVVGVATAVVGIAAGTAQQKGAASGPGDVPVFEFDPS